MCICLLNETDSLNFSHNIAFVHRRRFYWRDTPSLCRVLSRGADQKHCCYLYPFTHIFIIVICAVAGEPNICYLSHFVSGSYVAFSHPHILRFRHHFTIINFVRLSINVLISFIN